MRIIKAQLIKLSLLCALMGCQKDDYDPIRPVWFPEGWGEINVLQNGSRWSNAGAISTVIKNQYDSTCKGYLSVMFYRFSNDGYARQILGLSGVPVQKIGRYPLGVAQPTGRFVCGREVILASHSTVQDDGDVGKSAYLLDSSKNNYLIVTAYDSTTRRISGTFQASFIKRTDFGNYNNDDPVTVTFENGQFSSPIAEKGRFE